MSNSNKKTTVAVVTECFPRVSETFILNHITSLIKYHNVDVKIFSIYNHKQILFHKDYHIYNLSERCRYEKKNINNKFLNLLNYTWLVLEGLIVNPRSLFRLLFIKEKIVKRDYLSAIRTKKRYNNIDIIHAHFGPIGSRYDIYKKLAIIKKSVPIICSFHGYDINSLKYRNNTSIYKSLFSNASYIIANSNYTKTSLLYVGCPEYKTKVIGVGLYTSSFNPTKEVKNSNHINIITVARLTEIKGVEYGIRSIKELIDKGIQDIKYKIIGDGELLNSLRNLTNNLNIQPYIEFLGGLPQNEVVKHLGESDIFLLPGITTEDGRQEAQGLVIQEAQSMQLPVIVSNVGGIAEGIIDKKTGFLVTERSVEEITEKIAFLIDNLEIRKQMGMNGREFVKRTYDMAIISKNILELYSTLV